MIYFCSDLIPELKMNLSDRLLDTKVGVLISAVTTIHEISRVNPIIFRETIPVLFKILCETKSNWLIIKLIKLVSFPRFPSFLRTTFSLSSILNPSSLWSCWGRSLVSSRS